MGEIKLMAYVLLKQNVKNGQGMAACQREDNRDGEVLGFSPETPRIEWRCARLHQSRESRDFNAPIRCNTSWIWAIDTYWLYVLSSGVSCAGWMLEGSERAAPGALLHLDSLIDIDGTYMPYMLIIAVGEDFFPCPARFVCSQVPWTTQDLPPVRRQTFHGYQAYVYCRDDSSSPRTVPLPCRTCISLV